MWSRRRPSRSGRRIIIDLGLAGRRGESEKAEYRILARFKTFSGSEEALEKVPGGAQVRLRRWGDVRPSNPVPFVSIGPLGGFQGLLGLDCPL
jgi:hypothetical protein